MPAPLLSAVILNYRSWRDTVRCVAALRAQTIADRMEIIVVENHSDDECVGSIRNQVGALPGVRIVETAGNLGFGRGYEAGIRHARGEFLLINNPAKLLKPDAAEKMVRAMEADPGIGILGPKLLHEDGTLRDSYRAFPRPLDVVIKRTALRGLFPARMRRYLQTDADPDIQCDADWLIGGCLLMRRDFFRELGGFDPRFFLFFEDIDLCRRCWDAGKRVVYFPAAVATDRKRRLSEGGPMALMTQKTGRVHVVSALRYFRKWAGRPLPAGRR